jgi:hypothetical protein
VERARNLLITKRLRRILDRHRRRVRVCNVCYTSRVLDASVGGAESQNAGRGIFQAPVLEVSVVRDQPNGHVPTVLQRSPTPGVMTYALT